jgi:glycosyltransferase involved in cell wall biosynthesis
MTNSGIQVLHVMAGHSVGGAENMLASLVSAPRETPLRQAVVNLLSAPALTARMRSAGVAVHEFGLSHAAGAPMALARLIRVIRMLQPAAIQSWLYYSDLMSLWALRLSGRRASTRLYWGVRCSDMDQSQYGALLRWTIAACAQRADGPDAVVANSFAGRDAHIALGYRPRAFPVIPNGIDILRFRPDPAARIAIRAELGIAETTPLVIHAARVDPMKDHATALAVAAALPDITFVLAGGGTEQLSVPPNVRALGLRLDMPQIFAAADAAILTSAFGEGFPNAIGEAMAAGSPMVATDVGDSRRIVAETGLIVAARDSAAMAAALRMLFAETASQRHERARAARARIEQNFSLARAVAAFDALHLGGTLPDL